MKPFLIVLFSIIALGVIYIYIDSALTSPIKSIAHELNTLNKNFEALIQVEDGVREAELNAGPLNLGKSLGGLEKGINNLNDRLEGTNEEFNKLNKEIDDSTLLGI